MNKSTALAIVSFSLSLLAITFTLPRGESDSEILTQLAYISENIDILDKFYTSRHIHVKYSGSYLIFFTPSAIEPEEKTLRVIGDNKVKLGKPVNPGVVRKFTINIEDIGTGNIRKLDCEWKPAASGPRIIGATKSITLLKLTKGDKRIHIQTDSKHESQESIMGSIVIMRYEPKA